MARAEGGGGRRPTEPRQDPLIRDAAVGDEAEIARVHVDCWRVAYRGQMPDEMLASVSVERRTEFWRRSLEEGEDRVIVAEADGAVIGFVSVGPARDEDGVAELYAIYIEPERFGTGVGHALMDAALERMRELGYDEAMLWVLDGNERAERFYRIAGWEREDTIRDEEWGSWTIREAQYRIAL